MRHRTVASMARLMTISGLKVVAEVPVKMPRPVTKDTASLAQCPAGTSVKMPGASGVSPSSITVPPFSSSSPSASVLLSPGRTMTVELFSGSSSSSLEDGLVQRTRMVAAVSGTFHSPSSQVIWKE